MKSRDSTLVALLLVMGAVLYMFTPNIGVVTPDTVVTFAALAILLVRPKSLPGLAIGVVAGLLGMAFSKSSIAWFNIPAHAIGALATAMAAVRVGELMTGPVAWKPAVGALAYGVVSGGLFITAMLILGIFPFQVYITAGWSQVLLSTLSSVIICMVLYRPVKSVYERTA
ncbi:MAG: hypothetical protein GTO63_08260 [Anaerolineae bacterium]|nr:hypothetical protein [Anaerolineae bacterium]